MNFYRLLKHIIEDKKTLIIFLFIISLIFSFLSIRNHQQFQTFAWDLGFFDQIIWKASRFSYPYSTIGKINLLGDHFQPVLFLLAPLYWFWPNVKIILIAQAFLVVFAGYPLFLLAQSKLKNYFFSWAVIVAYLLFYGTQFTITNEFHQSAFIPLFLSLFLLFYEKKENAGMVLSAIGLISCREEMGLLITALGLMAIVQKKLKQGLVLFLFGIFSLFALIYFLIPLLSSQGRYIHYNYGTAGETPIEVVRFFLLYPFDFLQLLIKPTVKLKTVFLSFASFGFLPLLSPTSLIPIAQQFVVRFIDTNTTHRWLNLNHYAAPLGPLLSYGTINAVKWLKQKFNKKIVGFSAGLLLFFALLMNWYNHGPINSLSKKQLYENESWIGNNQAVIERVSKNAKVSAQNSLVPHLSQRESIYLLPEIADSDYIIVDLADGPNKYSPLTYKQTRELIDKLTASGEYKIVYQKGKSLLIKKI